MKKSHEMTNNSTAGSATPRMDKAAYKATTRTVGKWIVPLAEAQHIERELGAVKRELTDALESLAFRRQLYRRQNALMHEMRERLDAIGDARADSASPPQDQTL